MKGRKPKPLNLHILNGNPSKKKLNTSEPKPEVSIPSMPDFLNEDAKKEWYRITPKLEKLGLISQFDRAALAAYCQLYGRWVECEKVLKKNGILYTTPTGIKRKSPILVIANESFNLMLKVITDFGMTPSSRSRLSVTLQDDKISPMERLLDSQIQQENER